MKRKFSLLVAAACLFSSLTFGGVAHADTPSSFTDVTNKTQYYEGIMTLTKLGIINGYTEDNGVTYSFKPEGEITRAEFSKIIITALGASVAAGDSNKFSDIDSHWAKGYIIAAADRGIVNGMGDGTFAPDAKVTYEQAVKMIVCAAGYESQAQAFGGWPNGYITQAGNLSITKNAVSANTSSPASRGIIAQLMYNVLEVQVPEYDINGSLKKDLATFMETYLGIVKEKATVVGVEDKVLASFDGALYIGEMAIKLRDDEIVTIDYTTYFSDKAEIESYLGQEAVVYYRLGKSGSANTLYAIDFESSKNTVTVVEADDIDSYSDGSFEYYDESDRLKTIKINASEVSVFYNGKLEDDAEAAIEKYLDPSEETFLYGEAKFTDSGSDKSIDIVEITDYEFMVVTKTPSTTDYVVTNKVKFTNPPEGYLSSIAIRPDDLSYTVDITNAKGSKVAATSLKANDVLLVALSSDKDQSVRKVIVCSSPVSGKITAVSGSSDEITIGGKQYKVSDYAKEYGIKTDIGSNGTYYVDIFGTIVYATQTAASEGTSPYAYIIKATAKEEEETGTITVYIPSTGIKKFEVSGKIRYNGSNLSIVSVVDDLRDNVPDDKTTSNVAVPDNGTTVYTKEAPTLTSACQVAKITYNGSKLEEIVVADPAKYPDSDAYKSNDDMTDLVPAAPLKARNYSSNSFGGDFYVNSSTKFIYVPQVRQNENEYATRSLSYFKSGKAYWVQPYNVNSSKMAGLVVLYGSEMQETTVKDESPIYLLAQNHDIVEDEGGEQIYEISYYANSEKATSNKASVKENKVGSPSGYTATDFADIKLGDFFSAGTSSSTGLVNARKYIDYDDVMAEIEDDCDFTDRKFYFSNSYIDIRVFNVIEVQDDNGKYMLRVTANGFVDGALPEEIDEDIITLDKNTVIYRVSADGLKITPYLEGSDSERITALDLDEAIYDGANASKIAIYRYSATVSGTKLPKMILIYE